MSVALAVNRSVWPRVTVRLLIGASTGAVFALAVAVAEKEKLSMPSP